MAGVKQVRVLRNLLSLGAVCAVLLWLVRAWWWENHAALALGLAMGLVYGAIRWHFLRRRIARRDRRYERNKIFVDYLSSLEAAVAAVSYNVYLAIPLGLVAVISMLAGCWSAHWGTVVVASCALTGATVLSGCVLWYERQHGPLYYQYRSDTWSGAEGLLYQVGTVVEPVQPTGKVSIGGVLWNAVSLSGESLACGVHVEVIAVERLTLYVDRLPDQGHG